MPGLIDKEKELKKRNDERIKLTKQVNESNEDLENIEK